MMKFKLLFCLLLSLVGLKISAQNMEYIYDQEEVFFYGLDFTHSKMVGEDFDDVDVLVDRYFGAWNQILYDERDKYNVERLLKLKNVQYDINLLTNENKGVSRRDIRINKSYRISREKFFESVKGYDLPQSQGLGMVIFVETFHEFNDKCSVHYVFFDIASRDLLLIKNMEGNTGGVGFRNNWANSIHNTMEKWVKFNYRQIVFDKIALLPPEQQQKYINKMDGVWSIDDVDYFNRKVEKRIEKNGDSYWEKNYYQALPIPSNTVVPKKYVPVKEEPVKPSVAKVEAPAAPVNFVSSVDINIPKGKEPNPYRFALIIGNEDYQSFQPTLSKESNVDYANRDAEIFKKYAEKVLGVPAENIVYLLDAKVVEFNRGLIKMNKAIELSNGKAEVFVYYAGHGFPDQDTKDPYVIPVDVSASDLKYAFKLSDIYNSLTQFESKRITVFIDACFSGGARNQGLVSARGVKIVPKKEYLDGNIMVFSACSGNETAQPYHTERHGLFTYYLLKKLQETNGDIKYGDLYDYLKETVGIKSVFVNEAEQTPQVNSSPAVGEEWKNWKLN